MESAASFMEVSYHSSDDQLEGASGGDIDDELIYEEVEVEEEESSNDSSSSSSTKSSGPSEDEGKQPNDYGNASSPVRSKAPMPLHELLANKLRNTNVKLSNPRSSNARSVKELAAAFNPPRPDSAFARSPIETGRAAVNQKSPTQQLTQSPKHQQQPSQKKSVGKRVPIKSGNSKSSKQKSSSGNNSKSSARPSTKKRPATNPTKSITRKRQIDTKSKLAPKDMMNRNKDNKSKEVEHQTNMEILSEGSSSSSISVSSCDQLSSSSDNSHSQSEIQSSLPTSGQRIGDKNIMKTNGQAKRLLNNDSSKKTGIIGSPSVNPTNGEDIIIPNENQNKKSSVKTFWEDSSSSSSYSFSVSSGTDESLAAKIGNLGTPFAPLPIAANFISNNINHDPDSSSSSPSGNNSQEPDSTSRHGSYELQHQVSWSDLLGEDSKNEIISSTGKSPENGSKSDGNGNGDGDGDDNDDSDDDSNSYESYETASSDEFETDSEVEFSKLAGPAGVNPEELQQDAESADTSDYETDTTYERKYAAAEGRTPPPPKKPTSDPRMTHSNKERSTKPNFYHMPVVEENEIKEEWSNGNTESSDIKEGQRRRRQQSLLQPKEKNGGAEYEIRGRRRKPFKDIPTAVAAELRKVSKNDPELSGDGATLLGITGWDGQGEPNDEGRSENVNGGKLNCFDQIFKKKGSVKVKGNRTDPDTLSPLPIPPSPLPYNPPDYDSDDDAISNITDRIFSPKQPKPEQSSHPTHENPVSQRSLDASGRFSITSFRRSNSVRNTERALEGLKSTSIEPHIMSPSKKGRRNAARALAGLSQASLSRFRDLPEERRNRSPALLNMQNEAVDFYIPHEYDSSTHSNSDYHDMSPSSSQAFDSRDVETQRMESEFSDVYDPITTEEIIEEVFVGYDDEDVTNSRFEFNNEEDAQDRALNSKHDGDTKNAMMHQSTNEIFDNADEESKKRSSKRLYLIICIVICNLLLLLGIGTWLLVEYFFPPESGVPSIDPSQGVPALPPMTSDKTTEDIKAELATILKPSLPDGGTSFGEKTSPQSEALDWLSENSQIHTYDEETISIRFALATFYYATEGDSWTTNHLWLTDLDECLWYTSSSENPCIEGRYSRLVLTDNNLQGEIPKELSLLSNTLVNLDLVGTFTGEIPSNIGDLAQLTSLRLSGRILSGQIPESLYTLSNLLILDLGKNILSGGLSGAIGSMSSTLSSITLTDNHLTGSVPDEIGQLSGLTHFNIDDNYFDFFSEDSIGRLTNLETLSTRNNVLKGNLPSIIGNSLTNLKGLFLNNNEFTGSIPDSYGNLSKLEAGLDLSSNRLIGHVPESLGQLSILRNLLIRDNELSGTIPLSWGKLSILNTLRLDSTNFEGELPTALCDSFSDAYSSFYVDCWKLDCPCCNFCCDGETSECVCRFEDSLPILCVEP